MARSGGRRTPPPTPVDLLTRGEIKVKGRLPRSSNVTLLIELVLDGATTQAVYKPEQGERPLWDFPPGLFVRELAAYHLSEALGWGFVPLTIRREGPYGDGSLQLFINADFSQHYFTLREDRELHPQLQRICAFDVIANNTDRKSGHCLLAPDRKIYAVDNGLCFSADPKLRTVIWDFAGSPLPDDIRADLMRLFDAGLPATVTGLLDEFEQEALLARLAGLIEDGAFPEDRGGYGYPWPLV